jgi:superfamily II DNA/RNA helicase
MGIDMPNIGYIVHYQAPGSLEQYAQEIGRAGRDRRPAHCILLFDAAARFARMSGPIGITVKPVLARRSPTPPNGCHAGPRQSTSTSAWTPTA